MYCFYEIDLISIANEVSNCGYGFGISTFKWNFVTGNEVSEYIWFKQCYGMAL